MPSKEKILEEYQEASGKVSELNRNLALGGLAIIWIFKNPEKNPKILNENLVWALIFLVASLSFDLVHYIWRTIIIHEVYKKAIKEKKEKEEYPNYLKNSSWFFFWSKIAAMIIAYIFIFIYLRDKF
jgi:ABC-type Fe3+-siderophore transport system permease subunit